MSQRAERAFAQQRQSCSVRRDVDVLGNCNAAAVASIEQEKDQDKRERRC